MKQSYIMVMIMFIASLVNAQTITANDSVELGAGNAQMVFYQLSTGNKTVASMNDWQLAVTVRPSQFPSAPLGGTTIRINEAFGTHIYKSTALANTFTANMDTSGWQTWPQLHDSDTALDEGALNSLRTSALFDFGWGFYNQNSHNVSGDTLFIIQLPNGAVKKLLITDLIQDTAFHIQYSDIDGSNVQDVYISKVNYAGKNFVYLDLTSNTVHDFEPVSSEWDLLFLKYTALDVQPGSSYGVVGVLQNSGTQTLKAYPVDVQNPTSGFPWSDNLNAIGWNWKYYDNTSMSYIMVDSLMYYIAPAATIGPQYQVVFTGYSGSTTGVIRFYKQELVSGVSEVMDESIFSIYPNPTTDMLYIKAKAGAELHIAVVDMSGRVVVEKQTTIQHVLSTAALENGMYVLHIQTGDLLAQRRFVVAH